MPLLKQPNPTVSTDVVVIDTQDAGNELLDRLYLLRGPTALDLETVGADPLDESPVHKGRVACWSLGIFESGSQHRFFLWPEFLELFKGWLEDPTKPKVGHNIYQFDRHILANHGIKLQGIVCDTLRLSRLLNASSDADHSLKGRMKQLFGYEAGEFRDNFRRRTYLGPEDLGEAKYRKRTVAGHRVDTLCAGPSSRIGAGWEIVDLRTIRSEYPHLLDRLYDYASLDAQGCLELFEVLRTAAMRQPWRGLGGQTWGTVWDLYQQVWHPFLGVLWDMEREGITYDAAKLEPGRAQARSTTERLLGQVRDWVGDPEFNPRSHPQLTKWLYDTLDCPIPPVTGSRTALKKVKPGKLPTSEASLAWLKANGHGSSGLDSLTAWRREDRQLQFLDGLPNHVSPVSGRIHSVLQPEAETGRLTSKNPNLQQIPARYDPYGIRSGFVAGSGNVLVCADLSQLEMVILAHFLIELFNDHTLANDVKSGDTHSATAERLSLERAVAKEINYGINYGKSDLGLSLSLGVSQRAAKELLAKHRRGYPGISRFQQHCFNEAARTGVVRTLAGRTRPLPGAGSDNRWVRDSAFRQCANTPIQGSAADIVVSAMLRLSKALPPMGARIVLQVHDELIVECPESMGEQVLKIVVDCMENPFKKPLLRMPLRVDASVAKDWGS